MRGKVKPIPLICAYTITLYSKILTMTDKYDLARFKTAQDGGYGSYQQALQEIMDGGKESHWMWYVFPQITGLGRSSTSRFFAIKSLDEAKAYLEDEMLGHRLREITQAVLDQPTVDARSLMGSGIDTLKLAACMTLFDYLSPDDIFAKVLDRFYDGKRHNGTLRFIHPNKD